MYTLAADGAYDKDLPVASIAQPTGKGVYLPFQARTPFTDDRCSVLGLEFWKGRTRILDPNQVTDFGNRCIREKEGSRKEKALNFGKLV